MTECRLRKKAIWRRNFISPAFPAGWTSKYDQGCAVTVTPTRRAGVETDKTDNRAESKDLTDPQA